jgi:hypothetical protein
LTTIICPAGSNRLVYETAIKTPENICRDDHYNHGRPFYRIIFTAGQSCGNDPEITQQEYSDKI